jgi:hypothetical protein
LYLKAAGAPGNYHAALLAYNNAEWYVNEVRAKASEYRAAPTIVAGPRLAALISLATEIEQRHVPYCYGGGHVTPAAPSRGSYCWNATGRKVYGSAEAGLDCSSAVSLLLQHIGYELPTLTSGELAGWGDPGPGRHVTIWANAVHVYLQIDERFWGTSASNYRHGPGWHPARAPAGFVPRHPPGL